MLPIHEIVHCDNSDPASLEEARACWRAEANQGCDHELCTEVHLDGPFVGFPHCVGCGVRLEPAPHAVIYALLPGGRYGCSACGREVSRTIRGDGYVHLG